VTVDLLVWCLQMATIPERSPSRKVGYDVLRASHKKAYALLSEALKIDEDGVGKSIYIVYANFII